MSSPTTSTLMARFRTRSTAFRLWLRMLALARSAGLIRRLGLFWQSAVQSAAAPLQGGGAITPSATTIEKSDAASVAEPGSW